MFSGQRLHLILFPLMIACASCGTVEDSPEGVADLAVTQWGPQTVMRGTPLTLWGQGFVAPHLGEMIVRFDGTVGNNRVLHNAELNYIDDSTVEWVVSSEFFAEVVVLDKPFLGKMKIIREVYGYAQKQSVELNVTLYVVRNVQPQFTGFEQGGVWVGDSVAVSGGGMLTSEEGQTMLFLDGEFKVASPPMLKPVTGVAFPLSVVDRNQADFVLSPDKFGVYPGTFSGSARLENFVTGEAPEQSLDVPGITLAVLPPVVESVSPNVVRRGQRVKITGRGFAPLDPVGETATLLLLQGVFDTQSGKELNYLGNDAMLLFPEEFDNNTYMEFVLRVVLDVDGNPSGLGLIPGMFSGSAAPQLFFGGETFIGDSLDFTIQVAPQLQMVYVKFLPSFDESFHAFGLYEVREAVKSKILERCNRDYSPYNVKFVNERPEDYAEYSVIELSGQDPNGANLLGLDNTTGKDVNNLRFNDIVGGKNAETEEQGYYAYGGVFLESFLLFSPTISAGTTSLASPRFDDLLGDFIPQMSGNPVEPGDYPGGSRHAAIEEAIRLLGNLVGGTVAHEIGHSLGLAMVPGQPQEYHNMGDSPGWLMDAGNFRPFAERAEIDGSGPETFSPFNHDYLQTVLPKG